MISAFLNLGSGEIILIAIVVLLLFGGKKIPELMKGIGKGVRGFKEGLNDITDQIQSDDSAPKSGRGDAPESAE